MENLEKYKSRDLVPVKCSQCGKQTFLQKKRLLEKIKDNSDGNIFCSRECSNKARTKERVTVECSCCGKAFSKIITDVNDVNYCSRSCAAKVNGKIHPKRKKINEGINSSGKRISPKYTCIGGCGFNVHKEGSMCKTCRSCRRDNKTLGEIKAATRELHFALIHVRNHARKHVKSLMGESICAICGYSTYVEICHKRAIKDFPDVATLLEVNSLDNLVFLCPNHHKELDLGLITL